MAHFGHILVDMMLVVLRVLASGDVIVLTASIVVVVTAVLRMHTASLPTHLLAGVAACFLKLLLVSCILHAGETDA